MLVKLKDKNTIGAVMDFMCSNGLNYEVVKEDKVLKQIKIDGYVEQTCGGCPTIYEFKDNKGESYYFRLRHGSWRLENETTRETICSGSGRVPELGLNLDGCCGWGEALQLIKHAGYEIKEEED